MYEEAIDQPLTTEGTLELAKNWTLRYSHPHAAMGQSDTGSNEYEDSSDEYTNEGTTILTLFYSFLFFFYRKKIYIYCEKEINLISNLDDESTTATEDEDDIRARELRKQEVWLKNPTRSSDTDSGSETEVKISQDSVDNIIQESLILPVQIPNTISFQEVNVNNSDVDQDNNGAEDMQKSPDKILMIDDTLVGNTDQRVEFGSEESTYRNVACGSLIPLSDFPCNLTSDDRGNNIVNSDSHSILSNPIMCRVQNNSNTHDNVDESISEYESLVDESGLPSLNQNQKIQKESLNESNNRVNSTFDDDTSNILNNNMISLDENLDKISNTDNKLTQIINSNEVNDKAMPDLDITLSETNDSKLQTAFAGIMLPDAIPFSQTSYNNTIQPNTEEIVISFKEKLPDLITSSPNCSRESSPSSSFEIYKSTETLYDEALISDTQDKMTAEEREIYDSDGTRNYKKFTNDDKLRVKDFKRIPIVTVTSPSPTNEKSLEEAFETAKLTVPKEMPYNRMIQSDGNSSFDKLKRDLKQRKARNKIPVGELRPLSTENARKKMNIYFTNGKKPKDQSIIFPQKEKSSDIKVIELDIKPKLSNKVETKDIMKYFRKTKPEFSEKLNYKLENSENNVDRLSEIDKEFEEIKQQNEEIFSIDIEDIESKLHLNVLPMKLKVENIHEQSNMEKCEFQENYVNKENIDLNNFSQSEKKSNDDTSIEQTPLSVKQIDNILNTKSEKDNRMINFTNELPLTNDSLKTESHEINAKQIILQSNEGAFENMLLEEKTDNQCCLENVQDKVKLYKTPNFQNYDIPEIKLYEQKTNNTRSISDGNTNAKTILSTPQLDAIKTNKYDILHASDDTLNRRKNVADKTVPSLHKNSKSSSELTTLPVEREQITKVKIVEQNIEVPKRVAKMNTNHNLILDEIPKKPERKHGSSISFNVSNVQNTPNVPVRRKFLKQKANVPSPFEEGSTNNVQLNSIKINERLVESNVIINECNNVTKKNKNLEYSTETTDSNSEIDTTFNTLNNITDKRKRSQVTKSLPLINSNQRESTRSNISFKNDRTKKDKCIVS